MFRIVPYKPCFHNAGLSASGHVISRVNDGWLRPVWLTDWHHFYQLPCLQYRLHKWINSHCPVFFGSCYSEQRRKWSSCLCNSHTNNNNAIWKSCSIQYFCINNRSYDYFMWKGFTQVDYSKRLITKFCCLSHPFKAFRDRSIHYFVFMAQNFTVHFFRLTNLISTISRHSRRLSEVKQLRSYLCTPC